MQVSEYDYELPDELIAQMPADKRENSRMLVLNRKNHTIEHKHFYDIVDLLDENTLLVLNNTKVLPARLYGTKETGARIEVFLLESKGGKEWSGIDWESFFRGGEDYSIWDATKDKGITIEQILKTGKKVFRKEAGKPKLKDEQIVEQVKTEQKNKDFERTEKIRESIEKNRQAVLEARKERQKEAADEKSNDERKPQKELDISLINAGRGREF